MSRIMNLIDVYNELKTGIQDVESVVLQTKTVTNLNNADTTGNYYFNDQVTAGLMDALGSTTGFAQVIRHENKLIQIIMSDNPELAGVVVYRILSSDGIWSDVERLVAKNPLIAGTAQHEFSSSTTWNCPTRGLYNATLIGGGGGGGPHYIGHEGSWSYTGGGGGGGSAVTTMVSLEVGAVTITIGGGGSGAGASGYGGKLGGGSTGGTTSITQQASGTNYSTVGGSGGTLTSDIVNNYADWDYAWEKGHGLWGGLGGAGGVPNGTAGGRGAMRGGSYNGVFYSAPGGTNTINPSFGRGGSTNAAGQSGFVGISLVASY